MARWQDRETRAERRAAAFTDIWIDLCFCEGCDEYCFHVELAEEATRSGFVPWCPDCGGRLEVVEREGRGVRQH